VGRRAWWLSAVVFLFVLPVLAAGVGVVLLDPNDYKSEIIEAVRNATGRTLTLNGPVRLSRSLWPTIEVSDVTLANLPGGSRPDIARAERIEAQLLLPALLWHRIEVVKLTLVGPNILFEQVGSMPNWVFDPPGDASSSAPRDNCCSPPAARPQCFRAQRHGDLAPSSANKGGGDTGARPAAS
jgi:uncharacterized protein involved in outer membrane biogenesis